MFVCVFVGKHCLCAGRVMQHHARRTKPEMTALETSKYDLIDILIVI